MSPVSFIISSTMRRMSSFAREGPAAKPTILNSIPFMGG